MSYERMFIKSEFLPFAKIEKNYTEDGGTF